MCVKKHTKGSPYIRDNLNRMTFDFVLSKFLFLDLFS